MQKQYITVKNLSFVDEKSEQRGQIDLIHNQLILGRNYITIVQDKIQQQQEKEKKKLQIKQDCFDQRRINSQIRERYKKQSNNYCNQLNNGKLTHLLDKKQLESNVPQHQLDINYIYQLDGLRDQVKRRIDCNTNKKQMSKQYLKEQQRKRATQIVLDQQKVFSKINRSRNNQSEVNKNGSTNYELIQDIKKNYLTSRISHSQQSGRKTSNSPFISRLKKSETIKSSKEHKNVQFDRKISHSYKLNQLVPISDNNQNENQQSNIQELSSVRQNEKKQLSKNWQIVKSSTNVLSQLKHKQSLSKQFKELKQNNSNSDIADTNNQNNNILNKSKTVQNFNSEQKQESKQSFRKQRSLSIIGKLQKMKQIEIEKKELDDYQQNKKDCIIKNKLIDLMKLRFKNNERKIRRSIRTSLDIQGILSQCKNSNEIQSQMKQLNKQEQYQQLQGIVTNYLGKITSTLTYEQINRKNSFAEKKRRVIKALMKYARQMIQVDKAYHEQRNNQNSNRTIYQKPLSYEFIKCIKNDQIKRASQILDENPQIVFDYDQLKMTGLHWACEKGSLEAVKLILSHNANIESPDFIGRNPLCMAVMNDNPEIVQFLLVQQAKPWSLKNFELLEINKKNQNSQLISYLIKSARKISICISLIKEQKMKDKVWLQEKKQLNERLIDIKRRHIF